MFNKDDLTKRIRHLMNALGPTRVEFARKLGITPSSMTYYLDGRIPSTEVLVKMVELAEQNDEKDVTLDWLILGRREQSIKAHKIIPDLPPSSIMLNINDDENGMKPLFTLPLTKTQMEIVKTLTTMNEEQIKVMWGFAKEIRKSQEWERQQKKKG